MQPVSWQRQQQWSVDKSPLTLKDKRAGCGFHIRNTCRIDNELENLQDHLTEKSRRTQHVFIQCSNGSLPMHRTGKNKRNSPSYHQAQPDLEGKISGSCASSRIKCSFTRRTVTPFDRYNPLAASVQNTCRPVTALRPTLHCSNQFETTRLVYMVECYGQYIAESKLLYFPCTPR